MVVHLTPDAINWLTEARCSGRAHTWFSQQVERATSSHGDPLLHPGRYYAHYAQIQDGPRAELCPVVHREHPAVVVTGDHGMINAEEIDFTMRLAAMLQIPVHILGAPTIALRAAHASSQPMPGIRPPAPRPVPRPTDDLVGRMEKLETESETVRREIREALEDAAQSKPYNSEDPDWDSYTPDEAWPALELDEEDLGRRDDLDRSRSRRYSGTHSLLRRRDIQWQSPGPADIRVPHGIRSDHCGPHRAGSTRPLRGGRGRLLALPETADRVG